MTNPYASPDDVDNDFVQSSSPPFVWLHLLIAGGIAVAAFALQRWLVAAIAEHPDFLRLGNAGLFWNELHTVVASVVIGLVTAGLWAVVQNRKVVGGVLREPGHWLLLIVMITMTTEWIASIGFVSGATLGFLNSSFVPVMFLFATVLIPLIAAFSSRGLWRVFFVLLPLTILAQRLGGLFGMRLAGLAMLAEPVVHLSVLGWAIVGDRKKNRRDWPHAVGVFAFAFMLLRTITTIGMFSFGLFGA